MSKEIRCEQGLTEDEYLKSYCKSMSRKSLEFHWAGVFFECIKNGMIEMGDATDFHNILTFIKGWISVNTQLPKPGQRIDICRTYRQCFNPGDKHYLKPRRVINLLVEEENDDCGKYLVAVDTRNISRGAFSAPEAYCHLNGDYSHWMPTPELPKNSKEELDRLFDI